MAVRSVRVMLFADVTAFRAGMRDASRAAGRTSRDIRTRMRDAGASMNRVARNQRTTLTAIRNTSVGLIAAFGFAVAASARFEKAMAQVKAVTQASAAEMGELRSAALEAGRTTAYSASQAAEAEFELAKAGIKVADITGGALKGALNLAAAAQIDLSEAAEISATTMTVFGLKGKDVTHIADVLAAAANKSATDVHQLGLSFKMTAQVAAQTGLSLEDTTGAMALFASEGLKGSDAGTSFKVMLQRLTPQSKEAQATMDRLGFSAYDANGNFVGLEEVARRMKTSFSNLTPEARNAAMGVIFGSDAVRAAGILYKNGAEGVRTYTDAVNDQGYAAAVAQTKMDHLLGDLELLKSALEGALIESGTAANVVLRDMVQWVTRLVNVYNGLPPSLQQTVGMMTGIVGVLGLVGASMLLLFPRIMLVRRELVALGVTAAATRSALLTLGRLGLVLGALSAVAWGVDKLVSRFDEAPPNITKMSNSLVDLAQKGKAAGELTKTFGKDLDGFGEAVARIAHPGMLDRVEDFMSTFDPMAEGGPTLEAARQKVKALDEALASLVQSGATEEAAKAFKAMAQEAEANGTSTEKLRTLLPKYAEALTAVDTQNKLAAGSQGELADASLITADAMADERSEAEKLSDALKALNGVAISSAEAQISFEGSLDQLTETVKENGKSLDVTTEKGRQVKGAFLDAAKAAMSHAEAVAEETGSVEAGNAVLASNVASLRKTMKQAGFTQKQIDELTAAYTRLPNSARTQVSSPGAVKAAAEVDRLYMEVAHLQPGKTVVIKAPTKDAVKSLKAAGYEVKAIPGSKNVKVTAPTGTAVANAQALWRELNKLRDRYITVNTHFKVTGTGEARNAARLRAGHYAAGGPVRRYAEGGTVRGFPGGGAVFGPGSSTSDSIPAMLSDGEYVIRAAAVRRYGQALFDSLNSMSTPPLSARLFPARSTAGQPGGASSGPTVTYNVYPRKSVIDAADLRLLQRQEEARARVGRPR